MVVLSWLPASATHRAQGIFLYANFTPILAGNIEQNKTSLQGAADTRDEFQSFSSLQAAYDANQRRKHSHRGTTGFFHFVTLRKQAVIAGRVRLAKIKDADLSIHLDSSATDQRFAMLKAGLVYRMTRGEIVRAVEYQIMVLHQLDRKSVV